MKPTFDQQFEALTGSPPFPWQRALFERFLEDRPDNIPQSCNLPTGLGKTSVVAIWLLALIHRREKMPRRLVYVVNRRTVVDQTSTEVERLKANLSKVKPWFSELAISTLRGQFADNREWSADPSRPAVIVGTVDMIGSRLLFSGYGVGFKGRPLHAGFLGQDVLLVHDEAHLEPAFQTLLTSIEGEQQRCQEFRSFRVMELSATSRGEGEPFKLTQEDLRHDVVRARLNARKMLRLHEEPDEKKLTETVASLALKHRDSQRAILIFLRKVDDVEKVRARLHKEKQAVQVLTGTMRGYERDRMADARKEDGCPIFARFLPPPKPSDGPDMQWKVTPAKGTVYLICTSAGEVGVNISADDLVCDLSTFESMAQRFGRVNRFGSRPDTVIDVVHGAAFDEADPIQLRLHRTLILLQQLNGNASPAALGELDATARREAFAPTPVILNATDILFDAWSLSTIREKLPGRPTVEPYLHGVAEWEPPETQVAWREEVGVVTDVLLDTNDPQDLLDDYPLLPQELLRDRSKRVFGHLVTIAERHPAMPVWLVDDAGQVERFTLEKLADKNRANRIEGCTILLPPAAGGLDDLGFLNGQSPTATDVADTELRKRFWSTADAAEESPEGVKAMRPVRKIEPETASDDEDAPRIWYWYAAPSTSGLGSSANRKPVAWDVHNRDVDEHMAAILKELMLDDKLAVAVTIAAKYHDYGKTRALFQAMLGNRTKEIWAKSGKAAGRIGEQYRHEFGSLFDVQAADDFRRLNDDQRDLVLHLIAAHHGRARPHFPAGEDFDPQATDERSAAIAVEVPRRFARLQRRYGRWGLAYLESLLRAADYAASKYRMENPESQP